MKKPGHENVGQAEDPAPGEVKKTNWHVRNNQVQNEADGIYFEKIFDLRKHFKFR